MTNQTPLPHAVEPMACPFCGSVSRQHDDECYFTALARLHAAPEADVSGALEVMAGWNRRIAATTAQAAPEAVRRLSSAELEVATEDGRRTWANAIGGDECLDVAKAVEAACWVRYAVPSRQLVSVSSIDVERMIAECVPGGDICDHQHVADAIRRYCDAWPSDTPSEAVPSPSTADDERKAFEAWFSDGGKYPKAIEMGSSDGGYRLASTYTAWVAWQAAWKARAALSAEDAALALTAAIEALTWHYARGYPQEMTDYPRQRDARALRLCRAAQKAKGPGAHTEASEAGQEPPTHAGSVAPGEGER